MSTPFKHIALECGELSFSALTCGLDNSGPWVLCLHGFPDNARSFRHQMPALAAAGYRVVAPTLRGYEPSSQPKNKDYSVGAMADDIVAQLDALGIERVHLVGHDWGAAVAYVAAARHPARVDALVTLAVPHTGRLMDAVRAVPSQVKKSWYMTFFQIRGIAEMAIERDGWALLARLWRSWSPGFELPEVEWSSLRETFEAPGVKQAMLAYYRQNASFAASLGLRETAHGSVRTIAAPTLAITGADDGCMDTRLYEHAFLEEDFPAGFCIERIEGAGHFVHQESPEAVNRVLLDWLGTHSVGA